MLVPSAVAIVVFFVSHWILSIFMQTFFMHRYGAHRQFTMSAAWERFFYVCAVFFMGASFLIPRAYAWLHREHHAFSDTEKDPHSPHIYGNFFRMMWRPKERYSAFVTRTLLPEERFRGWTPHWEALDRLGDSWAFRLGMGTLYTLFYLAFAPHWAFYLLLPAHYLMGPIHGAIVNWCGHKYGYRNFPGEADRSKNTLPFDFLTLGELFQNNHHAFAMAPDFSARTWEIDPAWLVIRAFAKLRIIELPNHVQKITLRRPNAPHAKLRPALDPAE